MEDTREMVFPVTAMELGADHLPAPHRPLGAMPDTTAKTCSCCPCTARNDRVSFLACALKEMQQSTTSPRARTDRLAQLECRQRIRTLRWDGQREHRSRPSSAGLSG